MWRKIQRPLMEAQNKKLTIKFESIIGLLMKYVCSLLKMPRTQK